MTDPVLSDAIKEAYASAPSDIIIFHTLELRHSAFSSPIRVVRDYQNLTATLESTAPEDPSTEVTFIAFAFNFKKPEIGTDGVPQLTIEIDNVSREILANIELAAATNDIIEVTYREYISTDLTVPQNDPPMHMKISSINADVFKVSAVAGFGDFSNKLWPREKYDADRFPGLIPG